MGSTVTDPTYSTLDMAYQFFNERMWSKELPTCAITLQRKKSSLGYFSGQRIALKGQETQLDEIALNPDTFDHREIKDVLSTLVHEMCHLWQAHFGQPSRNGYHNSEWATEMKRIGLQPSSTGEPGGAEVGQKMGHYIIDGGLFDKTCKVFIESYGAASIGWYSLTDEAKAKKKRESKTKYTCPECGQNAWAKPDAELTCGICEVPMLGQ